MKNTYNFGFLRGQERPVMRMSQGFDATSRCHFQGRKRGPVMCSDTLGWRQYRTRLSTETRGYELRKRKDPYKEYSHQHCRPASVFNKHWRLN